MTSIARASRGRVDVLLQRALAHRLFDQALELAPAGAGLDQREAAEVRIGQVLLQPRQVVGEAVGDSPICAMQSA